MTATKKQEMDAGQLEKVITSQIIKVRSVEEQLSTIEKEQMLEEAKLQHTFDVKKEPLYAKRNAILRQIPQFWLHSLKNHNQLCIENEDDDEALEALQNIRIERIANDVRGYKIIFEFEENPFFSNTEIVKEIRTCIVNDSLETVMHPIKWQKDLTNPNFSRSSSTTGDVNSSKRPLATDSFFKWFSQSDEESIELANIFITDFYPNVLSYFHGDDEDEDLEDAEEV